MTVSQGKPPTPKGVAVLGVLALLVGLLSIIGGAILLTSSDLFIVGLNGAAVVVGLLYLVCGIGFFRAARWAWSVGIIVGVLSVARNLIEAVQGLIVTAIPGIVIALLIVYYLTTSPVKAYFHRTTGDA